MIDELIKMINAYSSGSKSKIDSFPVFALLLVIVNVVSQLGILFILVHKLNKQNKMTNTNNAELSAQRHNSLFKIMFAILISILASALFVNLYRVNFLESHDTFLNVYFDLQLDNILNAITFKWRYDSIAIYAFVILVPLYIYLNIKVKRKLKGIIVGDAKVKEVIITEWKAINDFLVNSLNEKFVENNGSVLVDNLIEKALAKHILVDLDALHPNSFDFSIDSKTFTQEFINNYYIPRPEIKDSILYSNYQHNRNFIIESSDYRFYNNTECDALGNQEWLLDNFSWVKNNERILAYIRSIGVGSIPFYWIKRWTTQWQEKRCNGNECTIINHIVHHQKKISVPFEVPMFFSTEMYSNIWSGIRNLFTPHDREVTLPSMPDIYSPLGTILFTKWMNKEDLNILTNKWNDFYKLHDKYHYEANKNEFATQYKALFNFIDYIKTGVEVNAEIESIIAKHNVAILNTLKEKIGGKYA